MSDRIESPNPGVRKVPVASHSWAQRHAGTTMLLVFAALFVVVIVTELIRR